MKKIIHIFLALFMALAMLAAAPVLTVRADCTENAATDPDTWTCSGADADGLTTDDATDVVNVDAGASVTNTAADSTTINTTDGTLTNNGNVFNTEDAGTAVFAAGNGDITNGGLVNTSGLGSTGIFTLNGDVTNDGTVSANQDGSTAIIAIFGDVTNNDTVSATGVFGTGVITDVGDNTIINNGNIFATGADGIAIITGADNDTVTLNSGSTTSGGVSTIDGFTYAICTCGGEDTVTVNAGATINGIIDGGADNDTLQFGFFTQSELDLLNLLASGGNLIYNGQYYEWVNFEQMRGLFVPPPPAPSGGGGRDHKNKIDSGPRVYFRTEDGLGIGSEDELGINVFANPGLIAFIPFASLNEIDAGEEGVRFQVPNNQDWYVVVVNLGPYELNKSHDLYQVSIFNKDDVLISDEQKFDF